MKGKINSRQIGYDELFKISLSKCQSKKWIAKNDKYNP